MPQKYALFSINSPFYVREGMVFLYKKKKMVGSIFMFLILVLQLKKI